MEVPKNTTDTAFAGKVLTPEGKSIRTGSNTIYQTYHHPNPNIISHF